jgi:NAD(P)-dependent dehydrogenase (short-subunit alcohol dehydrogenase family)
MHSRDEPDSVFHVRRLAYPLLKASGDASIVNVSSVSALHIIGSASRTR